MIAWLLAAQIAVVANSPDTASACAPIRITVSVRAPGTVPPRLVFPAAGGFQLLQSSTASRAEHDPAGQPVAVTEASFLVATHLTGRVTLPAITAVIGAHRASAAPRVLAVRASEGDPEDAQVLVRARLDDGHESGGAATLFVGQQADYVLDVLLNEAARRRLRRNPTFFPPDMPAVMAYDVDAPPPVPRGGPRCFETLTYRRALFPLFPGHILIPPATLTYALPVSTSFFSREETHELRTDSVSIDAVEPPTAGRPADYAGAIGAVRATARVSSSTGRMGDPLVLTVRLQGTGNIKLLPRPALRADWAAIAPGEERVQVDSTKPRVTGVKEFDWLLTPTRAGPQGIAALRYPYFDPERAAYDSTVTSPIALDIAPAALATADTAIVARLAIRRTLRDERAPPLPERPVWWAVIALAPLPATLRRVLRRRRRARSGHSATQRLAQLCRSASPVLARDLRRLYLDALRERVHGLQPATARAPLARQLRRRGVTEQTAADADALLAQLDAAAFSGSGTLAPAAAAEAARIAREVDAQAVRPRRGPSGAAVIALLLVAMTTTALFALPDGVARTFADGVRAYDAGSLALAQRQFARVAAQAPRAADAWANLGTAAWSAGDTAHASAGWERALRLDPLDAESRERLSAFRTASPASGRGYVPPVPVDALAGAALAIWLLAWLSLALPPTRRPAFVRPVAGGAIVVALVCIAGALELRDRLDARGLGVLRGSLALLESPLPGAAAVASGTAGEVGLLGAREGSWVRIALDGARAGWVPTTAVLPLEDAASN